MGLSIDDLSDVQRRARLAYFDGRTTTRNLDVTEEDASIALETGVYELFVTGSTMVFVRHGASTAGLPPSSGDPASEGYILQPGSFVTVSHDASEGDGALHLRLESEGEESAIFNRKVLP